MSTIETATPSPSASPTDLGALAQDYARRFPWYEQLLGPQRDFGTLQLNDLPFIDQQVLQKHYYAGPDLPGAHGFLTSGTSGGPRKRIQYGPSDDASYIGQRRALFEWFAGPAAAAGDIAVADLGTGHAAASARQVFRRLGYIAHDIDFQAPLAEHVDRLNAWQPDVLFTMPMILDQLIAAGPVLDIHPRKIIVVGDLAPAPWRALVAERFELAAVDILDIVGSIEVGAIGYWNAETDLYHFHDHIVAEVTDPSTTSGPAYREGDGHLVLTSRTRPYFPALRFLTGDHISGLRVIDYRGVMTAAFDHIDGRIGTEYKHGERLSAHDLSTIMALALPGRPFEVVDDGTLAIRVVGPEITADQRRQLREAIAAVAPDVSTMVGSGLVPDIELRAIDAHELRSSRAKRRFNLKVK